MDYPELNRGDKGPQVVQLQTQLNKVGAMLVADGDFGAGTEQGVRYAQDIAGLASDGTASSDLSHWLEAQPHPFNPLSINGIAFIAREETGGLGYYRKVSRWPHFPGVQSGITIGVGYDLRFNSLDDFKALWGDHLPSSAMAELAKDIALKGSTKRAKRLKSLGIEVPFKAAWPVFIEKTLPKYYTSTEAIYPSLPSLPGLCQAILVSLVFNRGASLKGPTRAEMRHIRDILATASSSSLNKPKRKMILADIEDEIVSMKRLWGVQSGLAKRRQSEANLWRQGLAAW